MKQFYSKWGRFSEQPLHGELCPSNKIGVLPISSHQVNTHTHTHTRTHARTHARTQARAHTHTHTHPLHLPRCHRPTASWLEISMCRVACGFPPNGTPQWAVPFEQPIETEIHTDTTVSCDKCRHVRIGGKRVARHPNLVRTFGGAAQALIVSGPRQICSA